MTTPYVEELALVSRNNEAINALANLVTLVDGVKVPFDLTNRTFFAQARKAKFQTADLICDIEVSIYGDPTEGVLRFFVSDEVMETVDPIRGHYDVLTRVADGPIDNLFMAPFIVQGGVSTWL